MADNALQTVQKLLQDLIAPDVRETKVRLEALEKRMEQRFDSMEQRFAAMDRQNESFRKEMDANFRSVLSAIGEMKANAESISAREVGALRERVAVLEATRPTQ